MPKNDKEHTTFQGFKGPNYTIVPDELFDQLMVDLSGAELKVLLYIVRRTFGFKRDSDNISLSQMLNGIQTRDGRVLDRGVGLSKKTLLQALNSLEERNIILTQRRQSPERGNEPTAYRLNVLAPIAVEENTPPLGEKVHQGVGGETPPRARGKNSPTQDTVNQETDINLSNLRKASPGIETGETAGPPGPAPQHPIASVGAPIRSTGMEPIATVLARRSSRTPAYNEDRHRILSYLQDISREFNDQAPLKSSVTRAYNLYRQSGVSIDVFTEAMYQARAITKERTASIRSRVEDPRTTLPPKRKVAYYFAVLTDLVGLKPDAPGDIPQKASPRGEGEGS